MTSESSFIMALRALATHPAARGLMDDAAVLDVGGKGIVLTHDMIVEGVHFLRDDPPHDIAWKLVAVNLSDLAAKGAKPLGALLGYGLTGDSDWDNGFIQGLRTALEQFELPLLGGDSVSMPKGAPRVFGLTAIGAAPDCGTPIRSGAQAGDILYVTGTIGDAGLGLGAAQGRIAGSDYLRNAYRRPAPLLAQGREVAPQVHAMMDVSDGLLLDALRMADASGLAVEIAVNSIPLSHDFIAHAGNDIASRIMAATAGDDYQLLFAMPPDHAPSIEATVIGTFMRGNGITLCYNGAQIPVPDKLGYIHS